ncbi:MAG: SPASM domain-containing protein [Alphaproteobacteria bacterium]|nr:SPASM domain-containing protein [Alphaproteobacteria bacterium]MBQ6888564.1 SPASM domain-containing protein [Lachnospiraceae bacterium]
MKKLIIFGAGFYGKLAFEKYKDAVCCFLDNDVNKRGTYFCGKEVMLPQEALKYDDFHVVIASLYSESMATQLEELGITDYSFYLDSVHGFYEGKELIINPYLVTEEALTESEWSESKKLEYSRKEVFAATERLYNNQPLFNHIEIETINRCNGVCSFCPVNKNVDPREKAVMSEELFKHIVNQLSEIQYSGRFTTFSNNEPFLDNRIIEFNRYARERLPKARMHLYTNGTLLTIEKFVALIEVLDELIIDNYQQELRLIKPCEDIRQYCENHPELKEKVTIVLRKPNEILTSRGGDAPNRKELKEYGQDRCVLPFKQMIIRPNGQVSLCCNDALGKYTLGDASKDNLLDIWYGPKFQMVRKCLYEGREKWGNCKYCDTFSMG